MLENSAIRIAVCAAALSSALAQTAGVRPASNVPGAQSPMVMPDRSIRFSLKAPEAKAVAVQGGDGLGKGPFAMTKGEDGVWTVTTPPAVPGFHYYWFLLDGVPVNDPGSETYFGYGKETSGVEVPEPGADFYEARDVPHGDVRMKWYFSRVTGEWRRAFVYTPPGYDNDPKKRYPLLLLQHGAGENETSWTKQGRVNFILDNLIAEGKALPMIVAMDRGYATRAGEAPAPVRPRDFEEAFRAFGDVLLTDLLPAIEAAYRTIPDREHRALAGLSMGGMQTLSIGLRHLDRFAYLASLSGPILRQGPPQSAAFDPQTAYDRAFADPAAFHSRVKLLWMGAGSEEKQIRDGIKNAVDALSGAGIRVVYFESEGTAHEWQTWRRHLRELAPRLFR